MDKLYLYRQYLLDQNFLNSLYSQKQLTKYVRLIVLDYNEQPIEMIEGQATGGSINIDGNSALRRTCSISLALKERTWHTYYWGIKNKFKVEIGLANNVNSEFDDIIWFPQGIYVITGFNVSETANNYTINISGKDKMCLLNGDFGGSLPNSIDFGVIEEVEKITETVDKTITETVVEDGKEVIKETTIQEEVTKEVIHFNKIKIKNIIREAVHTYANESYANIIINDLNEFAVELLEYHGDEDTPMYLFYDIIANIYTNFTLDGNTKLSDGRSLKDLGDDVLISRIDALSDMDEKQAVQLEGSDRQYYIAKVQYGDTIGYRPTDLVYAGDLISSIGESVTSILDKIVNMLGEYEYFYNLDGQFIFQKKRSYVISKWNGQTNTEDENYISLILNSDLEYIFGNHNLITSISNSPTLNSLKNNFVVWGSRTSAAGTDIPIHYRYAIDKKPTYYKTYEGKEYKTEDGWDWRELIYQMAIDYYQHHETEEYWNHILKQFPKGKTGYEQYYVDMQEFWRELYSEDKQWSDLVTKNPSQLTFWIDFMDAEGSLLEEYSIPLLGERTKVINDKDVTGIYFKEVPKLLFVTPQEWAELSDAEKIKYNGYIPVYIQNNLSELIAISAQKKSAKDVIDELLYQYTYCAENVTIQCVPIYHLNPNTQIKIDNANTNVSGRYVLSKFTLPLTYNGTMSMTINKIPEQLI